ncbi:MAG: glycosyl hydrolase, partial [Gemmatimonadaceae bacterium]
MTSRPIVSFALAILASLVFLPPLQAQRPATTPPSQPASRRVIADASATVPADSATWQGLEWRNVGPANTSGRAADVEGVPGNPNIVYLGSASGGVWKTTNGGVTWKPIFDKQQVLSIGDIALEPGNPEVIYVGTGEGAPRNSISFGNGVYKSTDGGATWRHLGLTSSERITRILVSARNPNMVYVGVLGHVFGPNPDRGVYMSANGGDSWEKVLYIDDMHGVADMDIDPHNPNILYAAMWRFERKPWTHTSGSEQGGVFRSVDAGKTWKKL